MQARLQDLKEYVPGYGISTEETGRLEFALNIEAADTPQVSRGENATAYVAPSIAPIHCRVARVLRAVSAETGQSIAWLRPVGDADVPVGNFVDARIITRVRHHVLAVPPAAVLFKSGQAWVIRAEPPQTPSGQTNYVPTAVILGEVTDEAVEIKSGLKPGDKIVVQGGIGYLYPDFKAEAD
ncbi:MAG: hypothetical protein KGL04_10385 [Elusimicrobia bacterium]|nr:hypothetical protein [Elusimicrobiota bacterium]